MALLPLWVNPFMSPPHVCCVFSNNVFYKLLLSSSVYLPGFFFDDLVSFPVLGFICFGQSPCPILPTRLLLRVVVDPWLVVLG